MKEFTAREYLKIDIASQYGLDKSTWEERIDWFDANEDKLVGLIDSAENPALFFAGLTAWNSMLQGKPSGYPVSLDATSSGFQLLAVLTGDESAAKLCNVVNTGKREDAYTGIYNIMCNRIGEVAKIQRSMVKEAIMSALYGSTAVPKRVFGAGPLLDTFIAVMREMAPAAWELNEAMPGCWNSTALSYDWVMADNYHVHIKIIDHVAEHVNFFNEPFTTYRKVNKPTEQGRSLGANTIHSLDGMIVREMSRRCSYNAAKVAKVKDIALRDFAICMVENENTDMVRTLWSHYEATGYLSARILDYIEEYNIDLIDVGVLMELINSLPDEPFQIMSIHDCFRCLPKYANDMRKQYNLQLALISRSEILSVMMSQVLGRKVQLGKVNPNMYDDILEAEYALS
jgi:hypothetical protein